MPADFPEVTTVQTVPFAGRKIGFSSFWPISVQDDFGQNVIDLHIQIFDISKFAERRLDRICAEGAWRVVAPRAVVATCHKRQQTQRLFRSALRLCKGEELALHLANLKPRTGGKHLIGSTICEGCVLSSAPCRGTRVTG